MAVGSIIRAVILQVGIVVDDVQNIAEEQIGLIVGIGRACCRAADEHRSLERRDQRELTLGPGADQGSEVGQIRMLIEDHEELLERLLALPFGEHLNAGFLGHFGTPG